MRVLTACTYLYMAEASADLWRAVMSAEDVHPDLDRGAAAGPGHGAAPDAGATAIAAYNRAHCDVATEYGVSWATAHKALGAAAAVAAGAYADEAVGDRRDPVWFAGFLTG